MEREEDITEHEFVLMLWSDNVKCQVYARLVQHEVVVEEDNVACNKTRGFQIRASNKLIGCDVDALDAFLVFSNNPFSNAR